MIYTLTLNPAVDYVVHAEKITAGQVNRTTAEEIFFGGKGINVSCVLKRLGFQSTAFGFSAGFTGAAVEQWLSGQGVECDFVRLKSGFTRINIKLKCGGETELNGSGPDVSESELSQLFEKLNRLKSGDIYVMSGSIPKSLPQDIYCQITERLSDRDITVIADVSGSLLRPVVKFRPFLVKPNHHELGELFGRELRTRQEIERHAVLLQEMGARNVLVSMAGEGALLVDENGGVHYRKAFSGEVKNSVGAGDSMLAGFIAGLSEGYDYALKLGTAAGGAAAFSEGLPEKSYILKLMEQASCE